MKKKGFTLSELLGVITILGLLALIVIPLVDKSMKEGKEELYASQIKSIEAAAKAWGIDHIDELPEENGSKNITLSRIQQDGYIESDIENPKTGEPFSDLQIKITSHGTYYSYEVINK